MLDFLAEVVKAYLLPGSLSLLLVLGTLGVVLLFLGDRWMRIGRWTLVSLFAAYWLMALPFLSNALVWPLGHSYAPIRTSGAAEGIRAVIVLGGGAATYAESGVELSTLSDASALRALEGVRLYKLLKPEWMVVSGGSSGPRAEPESVILRRSLIQLGVPAERILEEGTSGNTYEQAVNLRDLLTEHGIGRFVLVTSLVHMPRAVGVFRHAGLDPIPSPAPVHSKVPQTWLSGFLPSLDALRTSQVAMREYAGLLYYAARGWLVPAEPRAGQGALGLPAGPG
jgi:uncharacterized SAM-binding protein YcdF (DUF218 family)